MHLQLMLGISVCQWNCLRHQFRNYFGGLHMPHGPEACLLPYTLNDYTGRGFKKEMGSSI